MLRYALFPRPTKETQKLGSVGVVAIARIVKNSRKKKAYLTRCICCIATLVLLVKAILGPDTVMPTAVLHKASTPPRERIVSKISAS